MFLPILVHKLAVELKGKLQDGIPDPLLPVFLYPPADARSQSASLLPPTSYLQPVFLV